MYCLGTSGMVGCKRILPQKLDYVYLNNASYFFFHKNNSLKSQNSCGFQLTGPVKQVEGANYTPCWVSRPPLEAIWKHKTGNIFMNLTRRDKSLNIDYLYFLISKTTSYFVFSYEVYLTRYCGFMGGPQAQQAPSTWLIGPINWKPQLFWPLTDIFLWKKK